MTPNGYESPQVVAVAERTTRDGAPTEYDTYFRSGAGDLDMHQASETGSVRRSSPRKRRTAEVRIFGTTAAELLTLSGWLSIGGVSPLPDSRSQRATMSFLLQAEVRSDSLTGRGYFPLRIPAHQVDLLTGMIFNT